MNIQKIIKAKAISFIGQEEILGNLGFKDSEFQDYMETVGWEEAQAWCAYFAELVWKLAYAEIDSTYINILDKLFSGSAVATYGNFSKSDFGTSMEAGIGDVVIWQKYKHGKPHWSGHAGIVVDIINDDTYKTVEGNTNDKGGREGYIVSEKECDYNNRGTLRLKGFIKPL